MGGAATMGGAPPVAGPPAPTCNNETYVQLLAPSGQYLGVLVSSDPDTHSGCGQGPEKIFYLDVPAFASVTFQQTDNNFDSVHSTLVGSVDDSIAAALQVECTDDPDTASHTYTNTQANVTRVWFVVESYDGTFDTDRQFTMSWTCPECSTSICNVDELAFASMSLPLAANSTCT